MQGLTADQPDQAATKAAPVQAFLQLGGKSLHPPWFLTYKQSLKFIIHQKKKKIQINLATR